MSLLNLNASVLANASSNKNSGPEGEHLEMLTQALKVVQGNVMIANTDLDITYLNDSVAAMMQGNDARQ
ncbi:MAG: methyl-accepting chemotaxis protein [Candidatus Azotimanducaceae bacterium]|jgi:methyl-accepting chemotaxis protein